jgi:hypothetical protein
MGSTTPPETRRPARSTRISVVVVFSALIAVATFLSIKLPPPLGEITWAPPIYLALAVMVDPYTAFVAIALGSALGEGMNVVVGTFGFLPIYIPGMVWARAPEAFIVSWAKRKGQRLIVLAMVAATVYETLAFFFPDWLFYTYGLFSYGSPVDAIAGFWTAFPDFGTLVDLVYIPVALGLVKAAGPQFKRLGFA